MKAIQKFHIITVKYLGATNTKPAGYKLISDQYEQLIICSYGADRSFNSSVDYAIDSIQQLGFNVIGKSEGKNCSYIITDTFQPLTAVKA